MKIDQERARQLWENNAKIHTFLESWHAELEDCFHSKISANKVLTNIEKLQDIQQEGLFDEDESI